MCQRPFNHNQPFESFTTLPAAGVFEPPDVELSMPAREVVLASRPASGAAVTEANFRVRSRRVHAPGIFNLTTFVPLEFIVPVSSLPTEPRLFH